jgi:hypothetical protein
MLDADMNTIYWMEQSSRYSNYEKWLGLFLKFSTSATVAGWAFWADVPFLWKAFSALAALCSYAATYFCPPSQLKKMSELAMSWKHVLIEYELLWAQDKYLATPKNWNKFEEVKRKEKAIDETRLPKDEKLRDWAYDEVRKKRGLNG